MVQLGVNVDLIAIHVPVIGTVSAPQCQYRSQLSHGGAVGQMLSPYLASFGTSLD